MSPRPGPLRHVSHPRLTFLVVVGGATTLVGLAGSLSASPLGHGFGTAGLRIAILGLLAFFLGATGYVAFRVFEHGFE